MPGSVAPTIRMRSGQQVRGKVQRSGRDSNEPDV